MVIRLLTMFIAIVLSQLCYAVQPNFILIGPAGCGKGTFSQLLKDSHGYIQICPGDMFRQEVRNRTRLGNQIEPIIARGDYIADNIVWEVMCASLNKVVVDGGSFILDGYPRSSGALAYLDDFLSKNNLKESTCIVQFEAPDELLVERIINRMICFSCGTSYNLKERLPRVEGVCDACNVTLSRREADTVEVAKKRLAYYHQNIEPLIIEAEQLGYAVIHLSSNKAFTIYKKECEQIVVGLAARA